MVWLDIGAFRCTNLHFEKRLISLGLQIFVLANVIEQFNQHNKAAIKYMYFVITTLKTSLFIYKYYVDLGTIIRYL